MPGLETKRASAYPLEGLRVLELGDSVPSAFAGRWLAALGADVIAASVRDAHADPAHQARRIYLDASKQRLELDPADPASGPRLRAELAAADLLLDGAGRGVLEAADLAPWLGESRGPASVSVTPFGDIGAAADLAAAPITLSALAGMMWLVGAPGLPPLEQWGDQPEHLAGLHALGACLAALYAGILRGESVHYDLSVHACAATVVGHHTARVSQMSAGPEARTGPRSLWRVYRSADGWAVICALARNYGRMADAMDLPELAEVSPFLDHGKRPEEEARITGMIERWFASRTGVEIDELAHAERVPIARVRSPSEVAASAQLAHRGFFADGPGGTRVPRKLWESAATRWREPAAPRPAGKTPAPRARPALAPTSRPLAGVRVLDLGQIWAGPYAACLLADQGADVIKVESPTNWDPNRCAAPPPAGREARWWNTCAYFHEYSRNKRSVGLELRHPRGRELLGRLISHADVVIENLRADVLDRLGIGFDWMREQRRDVILVSMAAFGKSGPDSVLPGYGPMIEALSGLAGLTGYGDAQPRLANGYAYGDPVAATAGASAAIVALLQRARTGDGQHVDLAQRDVTTALLGEAFAFASLTGRDPEQRGNRRPGWAPYGVYPCAGRDDWVAIAVGDDAQWRALRTVLGEPDWATDPGLDRLADREARADEVDEQLGAWTHEHSKHDVFARCSLAGVPAAPVYRPEEVLHDARLAARDFHERVEHPAVGAWRMHGWAWRPRGAGRCVRSPAPDFGAHNHEVLQGLLGLQPAEIEALLRDGAIASEPHHLPPLPGSRR